MPGRAINYQAADYLHDLVMAPLGQPQRGRWVAFLFLVDEDI